MKRSKTLSIQPKRKLLVQTSQNKSEPRNAFKCYFQKKMCKKNVKKLKKNIFIFVIPSTYL